MENTSLIFALRNHAAETARYAFKGNLGTALDRSDTFKAIATQFEKDSQLDNAELIRDFAQFSVIAGIYACGSPDRNNKDVCRQFEENIERGINALETGNLVIFTVIMKELDRMLSILDKHYRNHRE